MTHSIRFLTVSALCAALLFMVSAATFAAPQARADAPRLLCQANSPLCTEVADSLNYDGQYTGHDEPSLIFYSDVPGAANSNVYALTLPKDPPTLPKQDGTGGTFNFQLHPAFWVGMAMCDDQSAPNPGGSSFGPTIACKPDSDKNIYDSSNPADAHYIGKHPGTAFMEMQFYPPGWVPWPAGNSCDATKWCAALNIDSLSQNYNTGAFNNSACLDAAGLEYVNFAFLTKNGVAHAPASPLLATLATYTPDPNKDFFMNSGDKLTISLSDSPHGLIIIVRDLTTHQTGSMTASAANNFGEVKFDPAATSCTNLPTDFHPMYSTSSEHTRVPWAAHSYNIAFSDEIGHFEYCNSASAGACATAGVTDPAGVDADDNGCFNPASSTRIQIGGCLGTDDDFDGPEYKNTWPGTLTNVSQDRALNPSAILFSSPLFRASNEGDDHRHDDQKPLRNFERAAFEADLPRIESSTTPPCQRHVSNPADPNPGQGCVKLPVGASFYPIFTTRGDDGHCLWQEGGSHIPGTTNTFGGSSITEYGSLLKLAYPAANGQATIRYNDFRRVLDENPCKSDVGDNDMKDSNKMQGQ